jgi:heme exporter protein C
MGKVVRSVLPPLGLVLLAVGAYLGLVWAPPDAMMGDVQRIMYVHVPAVWMAFLAVTINLVACVAYLFRASWKWDAMAETSAEVGLLFGTFGVLLGAIWGRPTWGVWWDWDPRLTSAAVMLVAYTGYLAMRRFVEDPERRAVWSAVVGIICYVDIPIVWFSVRWWRSLHQVQSTRSTMDGPIVTALLVNTLAFLAITIAFLVFRYRIALRERQEEVALPEALPTDSNPSDSKRRAEVM